jgi:hypothetical protein
MRVNNIEKEMAPILRAISPLQTETGTCAEGLSIGAERWDSSYS